MIRKKVDTSHNPQPQLLAPSDLPKDDLSQQLWIRLRYISPITRLIIIRMVYEGLSSSLIFHWYRLRQQLTPSDTFIAIRPILDRPNNHFLESVYQEVSLLEFKTKDPTVTCVENSHSPQQLSTSVKKSIKSC